MPIRAILFDKDGTLVDFQRTWGPATHTVISELSNGDAAAFERLAAVSLYDSAQRRLLPGSPVVIETTYGYGKLWAQALGIPVTPEFINRIDALFFQETLDHLTPIGDVKALLEGFRVRGYRLGLMTNDADANTHAQLRQLGSRNCWNLSPRTTPDTATSPIRTRFWRSPGSQMSHPPRLRSWGTRPRSGRGTRRRGNRHRRAERAGPARAACAACGCAHCLNRRARQLALQYGIEGLSFGLDLNALSDKTFDLRL